VYLLYQINNKQPSVNKEIIYIEIHLHLNVMTRQIIGTFALFSDQVTASFYAYSDHCPENLSLSNGTTTTQKLGNQIRRAQVNNEGSGAKRPEAENFLLIRRDI
jgi:hypothetical protein